YPYIVPIAATYWSQATAAVDFVKKQLGGNLKGKKIAFIFYDNPAGREPIEVMESLAAKEGFQLKIFAVPPPGVEMGAQVLDIAQRYRADFIIAHLFGGAPAVSIKELKRVGNALKAKPSGKITGVDTKAGFEKISNFTLGGLVPPLKITPTDHEGGGLVQIWQVKGGKFERVTDWYSAYPDVVAKHIKAAK